MPHERINSLGASIWIGMLIVAAMSSIPLMLMTQIMRGGKTIDESRALTHESVIITGHLSHILRSVQSLGVFIEPKVHARGIIKLSDGSNLSVSTNAQLAPDGISDAISWAESDLSLLMVHPLEGPAGTFCTINRDSRVLSKNIDHFLALTNDGVFEVNRELKTTVRFSPCAPLSVTAHPSIIAADTPRFQENHARILIPLNGIRTLYRDKQGNLRIVTHYQDYILENQPIAEISLIIRHTLLTGQLGTRWLATRMLDIELGKIVSSMHLPIQVRPPSPESLVSHLIW
jgi:hypothetical protein